MEIITEKITTNPPIIRMVEILLLMLLPNTSPKFLKVTVLEEFKLLLFFICAFTFLLYASSDFLENLPNIIPTVIQERI